MDERDFLTLAKNLASEPTEAAWRTAVSRAYYAAFHVARNLLKDLGFTVPSAETAHAYLSMRLNNCGEPAVEKAGRDLGALRSNRNRADYELRRPLAQRQALKDVHLADQVIQAFDAARRQPTRTQITDGMKVYERDVLKTVTWRP